MSKMTAVFSKREPPVENGRVGTYESHNVSIRMMKMCDSSLVRPLSIIFNNCARTGTFPYIWKKSDVMPVHEKMRSS